MKAPATAPIDPRITRSRTAILDATIAIVAERGVEAATIEAIAERSGAAKTTIYRHFPSKVELIVAALEGIMEEPAVPDTGTLTGDLEAVAVGLAAGLSKGPLAPLVPTLTDAAERDPDLARVHSHFAQQRQRAVRGVLERARSRGEIRSSMTDEEIIDMVAGPLFYRRMVTHEGPSAAYARQLAQRVSSFATTNLPDPTGMERKSI